MLAPYLGYLKRDLLDVPLGLFDGRPAISLSFPALDVLLHLGDPPILLLDLIAELAGPRMVLGVVDELQAASLSRSVFLVALLPEVPPLPVATGPAGLFEVAHADGEYVRFVRMSASWLGHRRGLDQHSVTIG